MVYIFVFKFRFVIRIERRRVVPAAGAAIARARLRRREHEKRTRDLMMQRVSRVIDAATATSSDLRQRPRRRDGGRKTWMEEEEGRNA